MIEIYTDGSSNYKTGNGGWAVYIPSLDVRLSESVQRTTNNRMEMQALLEAVKFCEDNNLEGPIHIYSDSEYAIKAFTIYWEGWQRNGWKTSTGTDVKNKDLIEQFIPYATNDKYTVKWVKGHAKSEGNIEADRLAYLAYMGNTEPVEEKSIIVLSEAPKGVGNISIIYSSDGEELSRIQGVKTKYKEYAGFKAARTAHNLGIKVVRTYDEKFLDFKFDTKKTGTSIKEWDEMRGYILHSGIKFLPIIEQVHQNILVKFRKEIQNLKRAYYEENIPIPLNNRMIKSSYFDKF